MRAEQSVKSLRKAEDAAQPREVTSVLVAAFICTRWRADKLQGRATRTLQVRVLARTQETDGSSGRESYFERDANDMSG